MLNAYIVALASSLLVMMLAIALRIAQERGSADGGKDDLHHLRARWDVYVIPPRVGYWRAAIDLLADALNVRRNDSSRNRGLRETRGWRQRN
jgi:hypothetical protein